MPKCFFINVKGHFFCIDDEHARADDTRMHVRRSKSIPIAHAYKSSVFPYIPKFARVRDARAQELLLLIARARVRASPQKRNTYTRAHVRTYTCIRFNESTRLTMPFSTHTHTHTHTHTCISLCTYVHAHVHACLFVMHVRERCAPKLHTHIHARALIRGDSYSHTHARKTCVHAHVHLITYIYIYIYVYV